MPSASLAVKLPDNSMEPTLKKGTYAFVEFNTLLNNKEIGLFSLDHEILIRKFYNKKGRIVLKADNKDVADIEVSRASNFYIIGKILNNK